MICSLNCLKINLSEETAVEIVEKTKKRTSSAAPNKWEMLIQAAIAEFAQRGYSNTEVQAITDRCSLAKGTLYLYFKSKEKLFWDSFVYITREIEQIIHKVDISDADPLEKIANIMKQSAEIFVRKPDYIPILAQVRSVPRAQVPADVTRLTDNSIFGPLYRFVQEAIDQKLIGTFGVEDYTISILNTMWGVFMYYRPEEDSMSLPERIQFTLDLFMNGMKRR